MVKSRFYTSASFSLVTWSIPVQTSPPVTVLLQVLLLSCLEGGWCSSSNARSCTHSHVGVLKRFSLMVPPGGPPYLTCPANDHLRSASHITCFSHLSGDVTLHRVGKLITLIVSWCWSCLYSPPCVPVTESEVPVFCKDSFGFWLVFKVVLVLVVLFVLSLVIRTVCRLGSLVSVPCVCLFLFLSLVCFATVMPS